ncbi:MAG TPA: hypothetical protein VF627_13555 [Abditibacterium sp.]
MKYKRNSKKSLEQGFKRQMPPWILFLVSVTSFGFLAAFLWMIDPPPRPYIAPAFRDPEVARKAALIRPGSALDKNMRRVEVQYRVQAKQGEHFSLTYLDSKGEKKSIDDAVATEIAGWNADNSEMRANDGILLKEWIMQLRVESKSQLFVSAKPKIRSSQVKVLIIVDGFHGSFNACEALTKKNQDFVSCRFKLR